MRPPDPATSLVLVPATDERVAAAFARILSDLGSPESVRAYREEWQRFVAFLVAKGTAPLAAKTFDVQTYLLGMRSRGKRQSTRARALAVIRAVYAALAREGVLDKANPAREARNPKGDSAELKTPWIGADELEGFLGAVPDDDSFVERRDYLISMTLAMTGLRRAETARVAIDAFEPQPGTDNWNLRVRAKGGKYGCIELVAPLARLLLAWAEEFEIQSGPLFRRSAKSARGIGLTTVRNAVKRQAARAGFVDHEKFTPHAFRRSLATIAKQRGVPVEVVQRNLLHSKRDTTERYMKLSDAPVAPAKKFLDLLPKKFRKK
jgi:site-specific recombinase XerD